MLVSAVLMVLVAACGDASPSDTTLDPPVGSTVPEDSRGDMDWSAPGILVTWAIDDLAGRLEVPASEVTVVSAESGVWSDGSIGCPEPGMFYTQALVPGRRVTLAVGGESYSYHHAGPDEPFLCSDPADGGFTGAPDDLLIPPPGYRD
jgi:hypothetical protein